eukprot:NODE_3584_length_539_cov_150.469388_g3040_i0.p1 GENE.NODE_3584_length_539_cov_150.469388_g3040_i0~~NODE_3584_length_539_cov_150.469388_g3040_i0.p1  ORF type:complete len:123 (+),score=37.14 NODE_3584_length_539_cov_150.469388_g3040_i0:57-371(+)
MGRPPRVSPEETASCIILVFMGLVVAAQAALYFLAILDQNPMFLYFALCLTLICLIWFQITFRHGCTLLVLLGFMGIVPSCFYLWWSLQHHFVGLEPLHHSLHH